MKRKSKEETLKSVITKFNEEYKRAELLGRAARTFCKDKYSLNSFCLIVDRGAEARQKIIVIRKYLPIFRKLDTKRYELLQRRIFKLKRELRFLTQLAKISAKIDMVQKYYDRKESNCLFERCRRNVKKKRNKALIKLYKQVVKLYKIYGLKSRAERLQNTIDWLKLNS